MGRQRHWWGGSLTAAVVLAVAGCSATGDPAAPGTTDAKPSSPAAKPSSPPAPRGGKTAKGGTLPGVPTAARARTELAALKVAPHGSMSGYSRSKFPHWVQQGERCDTRETVLGRDGTDVRRDAECRAVSGRWVSGYDGKVVTSASDLDIDHMVPLAQAWRSGAASWTQDKRKAFANDLTHPQLLAVSAATNRSKGDQSPDQWKPPATTYWCTYARAWVSVKSTYALSVTGPEKAALSQMLDTCRS